MALVKAKATVARWSEKHGVMVNVFRHRSYDTDDDIVKEHPDLFELPVEQATAAPGEKRSTRRPAKK